MSISVCVSGLRVKEFDIDECKSQQVRGQQRLAIGATTDCVLELRDGGLRYAARLLARLHAEVVKRCAPNSTPNPNSNPDP